MNKQFKNIHNFQKKLYYFRSMKDLYFKILNLVPKVPSITVLVVYIVVAQPQIIIILIDIIVASYVKWGIFMITLNLLFYVIHQSFLSIAEKIESKPAELIKNGCEKYTVTRDYCLICQLHNECSDHDFETQKYNIENLSVMAFDFYNDIYKLYYLVDIYKLIFIYFFIQYEL